MSETTPPDLQAGTSRPPTAWELANDRVFRSLTTLFSALTIALVVFIILQIAFTARPAIAQYGFAFLTSDTWDAGKGQFGIRPAIWGTLYSSVLGVGLATLLGVATALFLTQDFLSPRVALVLENIVKLLAAIPSVVYGLWGIFVLIPLLRPVAEGLHHSLGWIPFFGTRLAGPGMLPAALVLAVMVLPTITAISRDALAAVHPRIREAAYGLGATRWEAIFGVILPTASRGIYASILLAFGRALGETMALAMLIGNNNEIRLSLFAPGNTLAALLANQFPEASRSEVPALMFAALVLLAITMAVNVLGTLVLAGASRHAEVR
jgi:phosphate transport system permease protein